MVQLLWYLMALTVHTTVSMSLHCSPLCCLASVTELCMLARPGWTVVIPVLSHCWTHNGVTHSQCPPPPCLIFLHSYNRVNPKVWLFEMFTLSLSNKILFNVWDSDSWLPTLILHPFLLNMKNSKLKVTLTIMWMSISCLLMLHLIKTHTYAVPMQQISWVSNLIHIENNILLI